MEQLQEQIRDFCEMDDQISKAKESIKELKRTHAEMSESIINTMVQLEIENLSNIECVKTTQKSSLNRDSIHDSLTTLLESGDKVSSDKVDTIVDFIMNNREEKQGYRLKRKKKRSKKN